MSGFDLIIRNTLAQLLGHVGRDPALSAELAAARTEFFGGAAPGARHGDATAASGRFGEWFLLERTSPATGLTPAEHYREAARATLGDQEVRAAELLEQSIVGVFLVRTARNRLLQVEDVLGRRDLTLRPADGGELRAGDTLVGRLFPDGSGTWHASEALAVQRGPDLAEAFRRDVARNQARGILSRRLTQLELEAIVWGRSTTAATVATGPGRESGRIETELAALLDEAAIEGLDAAEVCELLRSAPRPGPVLGPILERVAFDSDTNLDRLQRVLLELWNSYHSVAATRRDTAQEQEQEPEDATAGARSPDGPCPCGSGRSYAGCCLGKHAAARIEEGLARGDDLEALFAEVEEMVGGPEEEEETGEGLADLEQEVGELPVEDGDLQPFLQEYAWETTLDARAPEARGSIEGLIAFLQQLKPPVRSVDFVSADHLRAFALRQHLDAPPGSGAVRVATVLDHCDHFFQWVRSEQLLPTPDAGALAAELAPALERADRVARVLRDALTETAVAEPAVLEVTEVGATVVELLPRGRGRGSHAAARVRTQLPAGLTSEIRPGDLWIGPLDAAGRCGAPVRVVSQEIADRLPV